MLWHHRTKLRRSSPAFLRCCLFCRWSGTAVPELLTASPASLPMMHHLGYPSYIARIIGLAKLRGAAGVRFNRLPRLKEWAYAGFRETAFADGEFYMFGCFKTQPTGSEILSLVARSSR